MNDQIEKLAKQAGMHETTFGYGRSRDNVLWGDDNIEHFAEVIVRLCADIAVKSGSTNNKSAAAIIESDRISKKILEHFGLVG